MYCRSPIKYQQRNYYKRNRKSNKIRKVPNVFSTPRMGAINWLKDSDRERLTNSLLAKEHLIIS
jgi:hypothetical protein